MNDIMDILVDNYIYVALGSLFLIIVLIGIVVSSNRKRKKSKNPDMVSMSDVTTGSINDVAKNLNAQNNPEMPVGMQPLNVAEVHPSVNQPAAEEVVPQELYAPMGNAPVAPVEQPVPTPIVETPVVEEQSEPSFQPVFGPEPVVAPMETQPVQEIPSTPVVEPVQEIPATPIPETPVAPVAPAAQPEVLDFEEPVADSNPLNGEAPEQNNTQNV